MSPYVDPHFRPILEQLRATPPVNYQSLPLSEGRRLFEVGAEVWRAGMPELEVTELELQGAAGPMRARLVRPMPGKLPLVVYVHGGGWTFCSIDTHENEMRRLAVASGAAVLGFDYRLAPEHPFPAGLDDTLAVIAHAEAGHLGGGIDASRMMLAGDSAGANIALGTLIARRDAGAAPMRSAALFYGCYAPDFTTDSHRLFGDGSYGLTSARMRWFWDNWLGAARNAPPVLAAPLLADLAGLPPLYLAAASLDPLLDDTLNLSQRLAHAGVAHRCDLVAGVNHGFLRMARDVPAVDAAFKAAGAFMAAQM